MEPTTTGQRIAQRRKMLGLSQEALGQQLGVSRQAISKWESDAATPEIGKLISLSHLFGVSIGWLLCEEESGRRDDAFTEEQLRLLEKVVGKQPAMPRWEKVLMVLLVLCTAVSLGIALRANYRADDAHSVYGEQISWLYDNYGGAQSQLDAISSQLARLQAQDDILADYAFTASAWPQWAGADITFTGNPHTWNDSDRGTLIVLQSGTEVARAEAVWDGFRLTATAALEARDNLEYFLLRQCADGTGSQQRLHVPEYAHLMGILRFGAEGWCDDWALEEGVLRLTDYSFTISYPQIPPKADTARWEKLDLVLLHNGGEVWRKSVAELVRSHNEDLTEAVLTGSEDYWHARIATLDIRQGELAIPLPELREGDELSLRVDSRFRAGDETTDFSQELQRWFFQRGALE